MMTLPQIESNPFALMMEPEAVFAAVAASERLARLKSRVCRPLDKPLIARAGDDADLEDEAIDQDASEA
jgi:hypothetical protein